MGVDDWDQTLFSWLWHGGKALRRRVQRLTGNDPTLRPAHAVDLEVLAPRLRIVASAIAGTAIEISGIDGPCGYREDTILLPTMMAVGESELDSARAYLFATAFQATLHRHELSLPPWVGTSHSPANLLEAVSDVLGAAVGMAKLKADFAAAGDLFASLATTICIPSSLLAIHPSPPTTQALARAWAHVTNTVDREPENPNAQAWVALFIAASEREHTKSSFSRDCNALTIVLRELGNDLAQRPRHSLFGELRPASVRKSTGESAPMPATALASGTERKGKNQEVVQQVVLSDKPEADNPLVHSFEKVHTAESYSGGQKAMDGADELDDHLDALEELDLREVIRTRERTSSIYRADALLEGGAPELTDATPNRPPDFQYDEWDRGKLAYAKDYCNVYVERCPSIDRVQANAWATSVRVRRRHELARLQSTLARIELRHRPQPRQRDGQEVDIDAIIDSFATLKAGHTPDSRLYTRTEPKDPTLGIMLLIDLSLSSDAYVGGQRVLNVAQETALLVGDAVPESVATFAVAGFHSNTRRDCRFVRIKSFGESWQATRCRLAGLTPRGYTRIGPAIRHATSVLSARDFRKRALIVITDGQPTDYDRYEGRHGVSDVRKAISEANSKHVQCFALAIADQHRPQLSQMFCVDRYALLPKAGLLPAAMSALLAQILK